jgi:hypothetical protein
MKKVKQKSTTGRIWQETLKKVKQKSTTGVDFNPWPANCEVNNNIQLNELEPDPYDISKLIGRKFDD